MGLFDRFRSKVKDLGDSLDEDELTAEEGTDEAIEAIESRAELESTTEAENEWDDIEEIVSLEPPTEDEIKKCIRKGTVSFSFVPVLCGSAFKNKGVQPCRWRRIVVKLHPNLTHYPRIFASNFDP